jgi:hypothetical protein
MERRANFRGEDGAFSEQFEMRSESARALLLKGVGHDGFIGFWLAGQPLPDLEGNGSGRLRSGNREVTRGAFASSGLLSR